MEINDTKLDKLQSRYGHFSYIVDSVCEPDLGGKIVFSDLSLKVIILRANA